MLPAVGKAPRVAYRAGTIRSSVGSPVRVLLIEDDAAIRNLVGRALAAEGLSVEAHASAEDAGPAAITGAHDLLIVDLALPGQDGLEFIEQCRGQGMQTPVLILSARRSVDERVLGLERGGDDYLTKPFAIAELLARTRALLRRARDTALPASSQLRIADLELDLLRREARRGGEVLALTTREFILLEYLVRNAGRVVTRSMILGRVWNMHFSPQTNVVDVHMHRLRAKIDGNQHAKLIHTVRGAGYVLKAR